MDNNNYTQPNGNEQEGQYTSPQYTAQQMNGSEQNPYGTVPQQDTSAGAMAVVSLILGILSIISCCVGIGVIFGIVAIILGGISLSKGRGKGVSIGGLVTGIVGTIFSIIMIIYFIFIGIGVSATMQDPEFMQENEAIMDSIDEL